MYPAIRFHYIIFRENSYTKCDLYQLSYDAQLMSQLFHLSLQVRQSLIFLFLRSRIITSRRLSSLHLITLDLLRMIAGLVL